jgi:hypothetical protein
MNISLCRRLRSLQLKTCSKCRELKGTNEFPRHARQKDGFGSCCKTCKHVIDAAYREKNREVLRQKQREMVAARPGYYAEVYARNPELQKERVAQWAAANPEKRREIHRKFREGNPDYYRDWKNRDPERYKQIQKRAYRKKQATARGKLENSIKVAVHKGLTRGAKGGRGTFYLLGYTVDELKTHLEKQFSDGMTWNNYGLHGWHVDHEIPLSVHNYETPDDPDFKRAWALSNLQPMWGPDNIRKSAKLTKPFQPTLALGVPANDNEPVATTTKRKAA